MVGNHKTVDGLSPLALLADESHTHIEGLVKLKILNFHSGFFEYSGTCLGPILVMMGRGKRSIVSTSY